MDTELRWRILHRLVSRGAGGRAADRGRAGPGRHRRGRPPRGRLPRRGAGPRGEGGGLGSRSSAARCPTPRSARCSPGSWTPTSPSCWRPTWTATSRWSAMSGGTGRRTWRAGSCRTPTRATDDPAVIAKTTELIDGQRPARRPGPAAGRGPGRTAPRAALPAARPAGGGLGAAGPPGPDRPGGRPGPGHHAGQSRTPGCFSRSSSSTARPSPSHSGTRQFGYWSVVPGRFCGRRSPTASASDTPIRAAGVRAR